MLKRKETGIVNKKLQANKEKSILKIKNLRNPSGTLKDIEGYLQNTIFLN